MLVYRIHDPWSRKLFIALCRRYGLAPAVETLAVPLGARNRGLTDPMFLIDEEADVLVSLVCRKATEPSLRFLTCKKIGFRVQVGATHEDLRNAFLELAKHIASKIRNGDLTVVPVEEQDALRAISTRSDDGLEALLEHPNPDVRFVAMSELLARESYPTKLYEFAATGARFEKALAIQALQKPPKR